MRPRVNQIVEQKPMAKHEHAPQNLGQGAHDDQTLEVTIDAGGDNTTLPAATEALSGLMTATHAKALARSQLMYFQFNYMPGDTVEQGGVVLDDGYLCIANITTDSKAAPQASGQKIWASSFGNYELPANPEWTVTRLIEDYIITVQRYIFPEAMLITSARIWAEEVDNNYSYQLWSVINPGTPEESRTLIADYLATQVGWNRLYSAPTLVPANTVVDAVLVRVSEQTASSWQALYVYKQDNGNPGKGEIFHQSSGIMRVSHEDKDGIDRQAQLEAKSIGGTIAAGGQQWEITDIDMRGSHIRYSVMPTLRIREDDYMFTFTEKAAYDMPYVTISDHYLNAPGIQGGMTTGAYDDIVFDNDAHGLDLEIESIVHSTDWKVLSFPPTTSVLT